MRYFWMLLGMLLTGCAEQKDNLNLPEGAIAIIVKIPNQRSLARVDDKKQIELLLGSCVNGARPELVKFKAKYQLSIITKDGEFEVLCSKRFLNYNGFTYESNCNVEEKINLLIGEDKISKHPND